MKKLFFTLAIVLLSLSTFGQSNEEIAGVYIRKAEANYSKLEIDEADKNFEKAIKLLDTITKSDIARLGALIKFELSEFKEAKDYAKQYFALVKNKKTETYSQLLDLYVSIEEQLDAIKLQEQEQEKARLAKEKELRRIDSLKTVWQNKSDALTLQFSAVQAFNKEGISVFQKGDFFGVMNDVGAVFVQPDTYKDVKSFDGYILLLNKKENPTQIFCFNSKTKKGFLLPNIADFNTLSTTYGKVMLPRGSGRIITYPNNSLKALVFDIATKKFVNVSNEKELFKDLRKTDKIEKYNKDGQVRIDKVWYYFGGHIGGGIYPLYLPNYTLYGFLCGIDGKVLKATEFNNLGPFYNSKTNVANGSDSFWVNQNGTKVSAATNEAGKYSGKSKLMKLESGGYQIYQEFGGEKFIILGVEKLESLEDFLRKHP
jgi:tetratricopeptide (TPR) repeat protein